ncbi:pentatricopeptide repeat-containing protein At3g22150, chloroplastic-like [Primulina eburnea]|uniref:pentatricopeptide repeat-containing protein At3g22150, chloroplastic-like n=1 Tax=Primulina eburnea TaxID=1245227 RepID=UPI003C6BE89A
MYVKYGWLSSAVNLFDIVSHCEILVWDVVLWNSIIDGLLKNGICEAGLIHFRRMEVLYHMKPDDYTLCILLGLCNHISDIVRGTEIHAYVMRTACDDDPFLAKSESLELGSTAFSSVLTACSQSDDIGKGCQLHSDYVLETWVSREHTQSFQWNEGKGLCSLGLFEMGNSGIEPVEIMFLSLISSCNDHCGFVEGGLKVFQSMKEYKIEIKMELYVNMGKAVNFESIDEGGRTDEDPWMQLD